MTTLRRPPVPSCAGKSQVAAAGLLRADFSLFSSRTRTLYWTPAANDEHFTVIIAAKMLSFIRRIVSSVYTVFILAFADNPSPPVAAVTIAVLTTFLVRRRYSYYVWPPRSSRPLDTIATITAYNTPSYRY